MRVLIIGGGIGGLAAANGLLRGGHDVVVVERDVDLRATPGYHITLRSRAQAAIARLLDAEELARLRASAADGAQRPADLLFDDQGAGIGMLELDPDVGIDVDRVTLRLLLAERVRAATVLGRTCVGAAATTDAASVELDDGTVLTGDVVVAADGVGSPIAASLAGGATSAPTGLLGISGRTTRAALPPATQERLGTRSSLGIGRDATALYAGYLDPVGQALVDAPELRASETTEPTYIWGAMLGESAATAAMRGTHGAELRDLVVTALRAAGWGEESLQLLHATVAGSVGAFRFHAAARDAAALAPWQPGRVTAIGDAVHATPPTAGMGAGIAIEDAADLVDALAAVDRGAALADALAASNARMRERGAAAIGAAMATVDMILATRAQP